MIKKLNMKKIKVSQSNIMSSKEALQDVSPIQWDEDVLNGKNKVIMK